MRCMRWWNKDALRGMKKELNIPLKARSQAGEYSLTEYKDRDYLSTTTTGDVQSNDEGDSRMGDKWVRV